MPSVRSPTCCTVNSSFTQSQLGTLNGIINVPSVVLALINGLLMDRHGPARIALWSAALGVAGALHDRGRRIL